MAKRKLNVPSVPVAETSDTSGNGDVPNNPEAVQTDKGERIFNSLQIGEQFEFDHRRLATLADTVGIIVRCEHIAHGPWVRTGKRTYVYASQTSIDPRTIRYAPLNAVVNTNGKCGVEEGNQ